MKGLITAQRQSVGCCGDLAEADGFLDVTWQSPRIEFLVLQSACLAWSLPNPQILHTHLCPTAQQKHIPHSEKYQAYLPINLLLQLSKYSNSSCVCLLLTTQGERICVRGHPGGIKGICEDCVWCGGLRIVC